MSAGARLAILLLLAPVPVFATPTAAPGAVAQEAMAEPTALASIPRRKDHVATELPDDAYRPIRVGVAVFVNEIIKVADQAGTFEANLDLRLRWNDPRLAFDIRRESSNRLSFAHESATKKLATIWNPAISVANANIQVLEQGLLIRADGTVDYIQRLKGVFSVVYKLAAFPFDTQALPIRLVSRVHNRNQVALFRDQADINDSGLRQGMNLSLWNIKRLEFFDSSIRGWNGEYLSTLEARIVICRKSLSYLFAIFIPFLLTTVVPSIMTLYTQIDLKDRISSWGTSILALVALSFTFSTRFPAMEADSFLVQLVTTGFAFQMFMILLNITILNPAVSSRFASPVLASALLNYLRWTVPPALIGWIVVQALLASFS